MKKIITNLFFIFVITAGAGVQSQTSKTDRDAVIKLMLGYQNKGMADSASAVADYYAADPDLMNDAKFWYYRGDLFKNLFKKYEKGQVRSGYREKSAASYQRSLELERDSALKEVIKKSIKFLATTFNNDAVRMLEEKDGVALSIYAYEKYLGLMSGIDKNFDVKQKEIEFSNAAGSVYARMFDNEKNIRADEYYALAKTWYERALSLDSNQRVARYNLVVLEANFKTKKEHLLREESVRKDEVILSLNAVKKLAEAKLYQSQLEEEAKKQELIILKHKQEQDEINVKAEQQRKDAVVEKEKQTQRIILGSVIAGLFVVIVFAGFILRSSRQKQKAHKIIKKQKEEVEKAHQNTKLMSDIGQKITASLSVDDIIGKVYENINQLMDASVFGIAIHNTEKNRLDFPGLIENGKRMAFHYYELSDEHRLAVLCFKSQNEILIHDYEKDYQKIFPGKKRPQVVEGEVPESIIYLPLSTSNKHIGVITVQSFQKNIYRDYHVNILRNLAVYVSIALDNSNAYNKLNVALKDIDVERKEALKQKEVADSQRIIAEELKLFSEEQRHLVEDKNKEITDSILYASRIQRAMFTGDEYIRKNFCGNGNGTDYFIFYQPKAIVSGDFYWALSAEPIPGWDKGRTEKVIPEAKATRFPSQSSGEKNIFYLCTADCTGHGVPGAFMSLLNISFLNENVNERDIRMPHDILNQQRKEIINALNPTGTENSKDGMDCVLCAFDFNKMVLHWASANSPLWLVRDQQLHEFKGDKMPVGKYLAEEKDFTATTVDIERGDIVFTFTDGFADQFGGPQGKKFKYKQLKEILLSNIHLPLNEQKEALQKKFSEWKGKKNEQVDDVLVIGVKI